MPGAGRNDGGNPALLEKAAHSVVSCAPNFSPSRMGSSKAAHFRCVEQDFEIVRIDMGVFRRAPEEIIGMLHDVLIERRARGHQHCREDAVCRRPARPARCQVDAIVPGYPAITTASSDPISMPSSSALVATTARMSPSRRLTLDLAAFPGR